MSQPKEEEEEAGSSKKIEKLNESDGSPKGKLFTGSAKEFYFKFGVEPYKKLLLELEEQNREPGPGGQHTLKGETEIKFKTKKWQDWVMEKYIIFYKIKCYAVFKEFFLYQSNFSGTI